LKRLSYRFEKAFVQTKYSVQAKSQNDLALVFKVLPLIIIAAAFVDHVCKYTLWRAIGITTIALMTVLMFIDSNTGARTQDIINSYLPKNNERKNNASNGGFWKTALLFLYL